MAPEIPRIRGLKVEHETRLKELQDQVKSKCNSKAGTKFNTFEEAAQSRLQLVQSLVMKGHAGRADAWQSVQKCESAVSLYDKLRNMVKDQLNVQLEDNVEAPLLAPAGVVMYDNEQLRAMEKICIEMVSAVYIGGYCNTASHALVVLAGETTRSLEAPPLPVAAVLVNHKHKASVVHGLVSRVVQELDDAGLRGPIVESADGEFQPWYREICATLPSLMARCMEQADKTKRQDVIKRIRSLAASGYAVCMYISCKMQACYAIHACTRGHVCVRSHVYVCIYADHSKDCFLLLPYRDNNRHLLLAG